jgi:uncharacterized protein YciI
VALGKAEIRLITDMRRICIFVFIFSVVLAAILAGGQTTAIASLTTRYYVVFLRPDPSRKPLSKADGERIQAAHMANIHKMAEDGILVSAGPFDDTPTTISGIFIFKTDSLASAHSIAEQDPTVLEHRNNVDVHVWQGPAGIGAEYFRLHKLDPTIPENMQIHPLCMLYPGTAWEEQSRTREAVLVAHERYIDDLHEQHKLGAAGKIEAPDNLLDLVIFRPISLEDARHLLQGDPAIKTNVIRSECHQWWSSDHVLPW